jgi:hypothetical protein
MATQPVSDGDWLTKDQILALSANMYAKMYIMDDDGKVRPLDPATDTRTVQFDKTAIDDLFAANPAADGFKIYFGVNDPAIYTPRYPSYNNKLMVALVATTNGVENLVPNASKTNLTGDGAARDNGKLCPPDPACTP